MTILSLVAERLRECTPGIPVFEGAVPKGVLSVNYYAVWSNEGDESASTISDVHDLISPTVWVTSVSRLGAPEQAAREAAFGAAKAREALRDWRPAIGRATWKMRATVSTPARPEGSGGAGEVAYLATEQFTLTYQI